MSGESTISTGLHELTSTPARRVAWLALIVALVWLLAIISLPSARFVVLAPTAKVGVEVILALASLFGALVLLVFPDEGTRLRLRWVAAGFLVLAAADCCTDICIH